MSVGETLRSLRRAKGLNQLSLARRIGLTMMEVMMFEQDEKMPDCETLKSIAMWLDASAKDCMALGLKHCIACGQAYT